MSNYLIEEITSLKNRIEELEDYIENNIGFSCMFTPTILEKSKNGNRLARLKAKDNKLSNRYNNSIFRNLVISPNKNRDINKYGNNESSIEPPKTTLDITKLKTAGIDFSLNKENNNE